MSDDPLGAIQAAQFAALSVPGAISAVHGVSGIFDRVPDAAAFPYVVIGNDHLIDASAETYAGGEVLSFVHVWSRAVGKLEVKAIAADVKAAICANLDCSAHSVRVVTWLFHDTRIVNGDDGVTKQAIVSVTYQVEPTA
jgi:hypothetical protein